ncbi:MAG: phage protease [Prevotellaceae bacterium]|nr:phage protease [Prevotellaceae bacterium]
MADREVVISTSALNSYGSRVLTSGIDTRQYERNPILLWMHTRGYDGGPLPIGRMEGIRVDGDRLIGTPVFDMEDEFAKRIASKWHNDFLRMVSAGVEIVETSADPSVLVPGQTRETVTRCRLEEVSIVDIGANDEAIRLSRGGRPLDLARGGADDFLPPLEAEETVAGRPEAEDDKLNNTTGMNSEILQLLGLPETATDQEAAGALRLLKERADEAEGLRLSGITSLVDAAIADRRINADKREHFISLGRAAGLDSLRETLSLMRPALRPSDVIRPSTDDLHQEREYSRLSEVPASEIAAIRKNDRARYVRLYMAEYGREPKFITENE